MDLGFIAKYYVLGLVFNVENFVLALASLVKTNMVVKDFSKNHLLIPCLLWRKLQDNLP